MHQETGFKTIPFKGIPDKFFDVGIMDFCVFRPLKNALPRR